MTRVLVFGGTGHTGRLIAMNAVEDGHAVTVTARNPETSPVSEADGVRLVRADVRNSDSVRNALAGQDAVILAVSTPARDPGGLYSDAARAIVAAAAPGTRLIAISSGGVNRTDPALPGWYRRVLIPLFMSDLYDDMGEMEGVVRASALDWTLVRASYLRDGPPTGAFRVADGVTPPKGWKLSRADLARFAVDQLGTEDWLRRTPTLAR
jgi:uncharacterized protein YbjT (DUF2867 family)